MIMTTVLVTMYCDKATKLYIKVYLGVKSIKPLRVKLFGRRVTQRVNLFVIKTEDLSSILMTHMVEEGN